MVELTKPIILKNGIVVPAGVRLEFKNGKAKYQNYPVERMLIPLQIIKGAKGPFLNAAVATLLNDNQRFQQIFNKKFQDWAHVIAFGDFLIVYVWDTRDVIDVIPGLHSGAKGGPVIQEKDLIRKSDGQKIHESKVIGHNKWGWSKGIYEMLMFPGYHRQDNGLPLKTDNKDWKPIIDKFNERIEKQFAYECLFGPDVAMETEESLDYEDACDAQERNSIDYEDENTRMELAKRGQAMPDGSYPIPNRMYLLNAIKSVGRAKDYEEVKAFIIRRAIELGCYDDLPDSWK